MKYVLVISFLISSCNQKNDSSVIRIHISPELANIAEKYYANFKERQDTIRFIQLLEFGKDTSKVVLHCFGKDAELLNHFDIIGIDSVNSKIVYIGIRKNELIIGEASNINDRPIIREYCPWLIGSSEESAFIISSCYQQFNSDVNEHIEFEDIEVK